MPERVPISLTTGSYESQSPSVALQQSINLYPQIPQTVLAANQEALFNTPGINEILSISTGPNRGLITFQNELYGVSGTTFYRVDSNLTVTTLGTVDGTAFCSLAENGQSITIVVPRLKAYFYDTTNGLVEITDAAFLGYGEVTTVTYLDGYFIYTTDKEFFLSSLVTVNQGQDFDALDFSTAEADTDDIVRAFAFSGELYIFGTESIEVFRNVGGAGFPFQRIPGAFVDKGLAAVNSVQRFAGSYVYVGKRTEEGPSVWIGTSGSAQKLSTAAIDVKLQALTPEELQDIKSWTYSEAGNFFVGFNLADTTIVYDQTVSQLSGRQVWHERQSDGTSYRVNQIIDIFSIIVAGDAIDGRLGEITLGSVTEYDATVDRQFTTGYIQADGRILYVPRLEMITESGVGLIKDASVSTDPQVGMSYTNDGGNEFTDIQNRAIGREGETQARQIWRRLGATRFSRAFRFTVSEQVPVSFIELTVDIEPGVPI